MKKLTFILSCTILFSLLSSHPCPSQDTFPDGTPWYWVDAEGNQRTRTDLDTLIEQKEIGVDLSGTFFEYLELKGDSLGYANFGNAEVYHSDFTKAVLNMAIFRDAILDTANFTEAKLHNADFRNARLWDAKFVSAELIQANFESADMRRSELMIAVLQKAHLRNAHLVKANLSGADMYSANLCGADLTDANLKDAYLEGANLKGILFEPEVLPTTLDIAYARNLDRMIFNFNPAPLVQLRNSFSDLGFSAQAKFVNAALRRVDQNFLEYIFYDLTCEWGSNHLRPLFILLGSWFVFWYIYSYASIWHDRSGKYFIGSEVTTMKELAIEFSEWRLLDKPWKALGIAFLFSLHRALRIGFREFSPSSWLMMLLPPNFKMISRGWPRFISGLQSLFSVAMIVLSLLCYFGRPFEF